MSPCLSVEVGIDPQLTRLFLLRQPMVVDAAVWYSRGRLHAEVAVTDERSADAAKLIERCARALGQFQAPKEIRLVSVRACAA